MSPRKIYSLSMFKVKDKCQNISFNHELLFSSKQNIPQRNPKMNHLMAKYKFCKHLGRETTTFVKVTFGQIYDIRDLVQIIMHTINMISLSRLYHLKIFTSWPHSEQCNIAINKSRRDQSGNLRVSCIIFVHFAYFNDKDWPKYNWSPRPD